MKTKIAALLSLTMLLVLVAPVQAAIPTTAIIRVVEDEYVLLRTYNFPANDTFLVRMGERNTRGVGGILVDKITSGSGGSFLAKFYIPEELKGMEVISIRMESAYSAYYSYNWFYNSTAISSSSSGSTGTTTTTTTATFMPDGFPTFIFLAVDQGQTVQVQVKNFPPDEVWGVFMKDGASAAKTWYEVAGFNSEEGGVFDATFNIPVQLAYKSKIAIKMISNKTGLVTYNLFNNVDYP